MSEVWPSDDVMEIIEAVPETPLNDWILGMASEPPPRPANWHTWLNGICECGVRWLDIRNVREGDEWPGVMAGAAKNDGFSHVGSRNLCEQRWVDWCRDQEDRAIAEAMGWGSKGAGESVPQELVVF